MVPGRAPVLTEELQVLEENLGSSIIMFVVVGRGGGGPCRDGLL